MLDCRAKQRKYYKTFHKLIIAHTYKPVVSNQCTSVQIKQYNVIGKTPACIIISGATTGGSGGSRLRALARRGRLATSVKFFFNTTLTLRRIAMHCVALHCIVLYYTLKLLQSTVVF